MGNASPHGREADVRGLRGCPGGPAKRDRRSLMSNAIRAQLRSSVHGSQCDLYRGK
ncbi:MAG: hypothetical protein IJR36_06950 [Lachnospiraceae bacterium]|nr:hypothetical protein [Lachnospiraceae bacterium]